MRAGITVAVVIRKKSTTMTAMKPKPQDTTTHEHSINENTNIPLWLFPPFPKRPNNDTTPSKELSLCARHELRAGDNSSQC